MMNQAIHEAVRGARRWRSRCHNANLGRDGQRVCKTYVKATGRPRGRR
jgi:hypothetical protein